MIESMFLAFFAAAGILAVVWCFLGILLLPVYGRGMITVCCVEGNGSDMEQLVRGFGWLRDGKSSGGKLLFVDCGLTEEGLQILKKLQDTYPWISYCPGAALPDYMELELERVQAHALPVDLGNHV